MKSIQIEAWALRIVDQIGNKQPNEDFLVELKRDWIEPYKAARRIAGHANAARGENILWLMGVDEKEGVIKVSDGYDLAKWYPQVKSYFNELAPEMISLNIPINGLTVVALLFETDRAPFVVKNLKYGSTGGGNVELEVPWREGTTIKTARRSDLIRLLAPIERSPEVEVINLSIEGIIGGEDRYGNHQPDDLRLSGELYVIPKNRDSIIIPFHRCQIEFKFPNIPTFEAHSIVLEPDGCRTHRLISGYESASYTAQSTPNEILINNAGKILLKASGKRPSISNQAEKCNVIVSIALLPVNTERPIIIKQTLNYSES